MSRAYIILFHTSSIQTGHTEQDHRIDFLCYGVRHHTYPRWGSKT